MKMRQKQCCALLLSSTIAMSSLLTGCSLNGNIPQKDTELRIMGTSNAIQTGLLSSPWNDISLITRLVYRNLFTIEAESDIIKPDLAESYTISEDGLTYTLVLRDDLVWSDGEKITMEDVIFSFETLLLAKGEVAILSNAFAYIEGANDFLKGEVDSLSGLSVDGQELTIRLEKPIATFMEVLAQFAILPKHALEDENPKTIFESDFWCDPIVSGMYVFDEFVEGEYLKYTYNDEYIGTAPNIESIHMRADYEYNELDCYTTNDIDKILEFRSVPRMKEMDIDTLFYRYLVYNINKGGEEDSVLADRRVREAIAYSIDLVSLVESIYFNTAHIIENGGVLLESDNLKGLVPTYNPELAKELLLEAGYDFDRPIVLLNYYTDESSKNLIIGIGENLKDIGLEVEIIQGGDLYSEEYDHYDVALKGLAAFDIVEWYMEYHSTHELYKEVFGQEPVFDALIDKLDATTNHEDKAIVLDELQEQGFESFYKYPLFLLGYKAYVNTSRLTIPEDVCLGNPEFRYDVSFEEWVIK